MWRATVIGEKATAIAALIASPENVHDRMQDRDTTDS